MPKLDPERGRRCPLMLRLSPAAVGFAALCTQVLLLRELMVAWRGNEMSFGVSLSVWLAAAGAGGLLYGALSGRLTATPRGLARSLLALGALAPVALTAARLTRTALGLPAGELAGLSHLLLGAVVSLVPFAVSVGFIFALAIAVTAKCGGSGTRAIGAVYVLEAAGAVVAGALMSFVFLSRLSPVTVSLLSTSLCAAVAFGLSWRLPSSRRVRGGLPATAAAVAVLAAIAMPGLGRRLDDLTVATQWRELGFRSQANSVYGRVVTTELGSQVSVYESGVLVASHPDRLSAEESVHLAMLQHPEPRAVLMIGGCLGGAVAEALKHPDVERVDCVELDPTLITEARGQFADRMLGGMDDPRVSVHYGDARFFVKRASGPYDVVLLSVPDPTTARLNRFYTAEFFAEVREILDPEGVLGLSLSSSENYVGEELADVLACVERTLSLEFGEVVLTPGDRCHMLAAAAGVTLTREAAELVSRIEERSLDVLYVRDYYLFDRLSPERTATLEDAVSRARPTVNTDLTPSGYYLSLLLWDRQLAASRGALAAAEPFANVRTAMLAAVLLAAFALAPATRRAGRSTAFRRSVFVSVFVVGLTEISLEIASMLAFQSLYGYVYDRVALLVAAFMAGLAAGGWIGRRAVARGVGAGAFVALQAGIALVPMGLWRAVAAVATLDPGRLEAWSNAFPLLVVASAVLAGVQFPLAASLCARRSEEPGGTGGRLYGADLTGAAVGATLTAVLLLPVLGLFGAMRALALLNAGALAALALSALLAGRARLTKPL